MPFIDARRWESGVWTVAPMCSPVSGGFHIQVIFSLRGCVCGTSHSVCVVAKNQISYSYFEITYDSKKSY